MSAEFGHKLPQTKFSFGFGPVSVETAGKGPRPTESGAETLPESEPFNSFRL